jgi:hypothetical protein
MTVIIGGSGTANGISSFSSPATFGGTLATAPRGISNASVPSGGIIQVVQTYDTTYRSTTSSTYQDCFSRSITPSSSTSKILVMVSLSLSHPDNDTGYVRILRDSTEIGSGTATGSLPGVLFAVRIYSYENTNNNYNQHQYSQSYIDSPGTTSSITYKIQFRDAQGNGRGIAMNGAINSSTADSNFGRTTSSITLFEIAQ